MSSKRSEKVEKVKADTSVLCEQCGRKIPKERLKVIPDTDLCVHCAAKSESEGGIDRVIILDDYDPNELLDAISSDD